MNSKSAILFGAVRQLAVSKGIDKVKVQKQNLYILTPFENTSSSIRFDLAEAAHGVALNRNDVFVADGRIALGFQAVWVENGKEFPANTSVLFSPEDLANPSLMDTARSLNPLYNGKLELKSDTDVRIQDFRTDGFKGNPKTSVNYQNIHFEDFTPMLFVGGRGNSATVTFGAGDFSKIAGIPHGPTAEWKMYGCLVLPGVRIIGGVTNGSLLSDLDKLTK
jgi:hypothetical protein